MKTKILISSKNPLDTIGGVEVFVQQICSELPHAIHINDKHLFREIPEADRYIVNLPSVIGLRIIISKKNTTVYHHGRDLRNFKMLPYYILENMVFFLRKKSIYSNFKFNLTKTQVIPGYICPTLSEEIPKSKRTVDVIFCGRLEKYKGAEQLPFLLNILADKGLKSQIVIGDGSFKNHILKNAKNAEIIGYLSRKELAKIFARTRYILIPSISNQESLSFVQIEAMRLGVIPIINSDLHGVIRPHKLFGQKSYIDINLLDIPCEKVENEMSRWAVRASVEWEKRAKKFMKDLLNEE